MSVCTPTAMSKSSGSTRPDDGSGTSSHSEDATDSFFEDTAYEGAKSFSLTSALLSSSEEAVRQDLPSNGNFTSDLLPPPGLGGLLPMSTRDGSDMIIPDPTMNRMTPWSLEQDTMTVSALPCKDWKQLFPPSFLGEEYLQNWNKGEPALICPSTAVAGGTLASDDPQHLVCENKVLVAENERLAKENEMLRNSYMQSMWTPDMSPAAFWSGQSPMSMDMYGMVGFCPPSLWGLEGQWSTEGADSKPNSTRRASDPGPESQICNKDQAGAKNPTEIRIGRSQTESDAFSSDELTTVMLRNLPNNYSRTMLLQLIDKEGFAGQYDFIYLPMDFKLHASLGYAFVNLVSPEVATRFFKTFEGFHRWVVPSQKVCSVNWSHPYQGLDAHIERYRNSPVMHDDVPDEYKPSVFQNGQRVPFQPPTKKLKFPRMRPSPDTPGMQQSCS